MFYIKENASNAIINSLGKRPYKLINEKGKIKFNGEDIILFGICSSPVKKLNIFSTGAPNKCTKEDGGVVL